MNEISSKTKSGYSAIAYLLKQERNTSTPTFFFFGGGSIGPSMLSAFDRGSHIIDLLNAIEPDAMATTKRDFSFFEDELSLRSYEAAFPFVATNILDKKTNKSLDGLIQSVVTQQGPYKIGVVSTLSPIAIDEYNLKRIIITDKIKAVKEQVALLRKKRIDLVVLINTGIESDVIELLEDKTVDLILHKDSNTQTRSSQQLADIPNYVLVKGIDEIAVINVTWPKSTAKEPSVNTKLYRYSALNKDSDMELMVERYEERLSALLDEVIGVNKTQMNTMRSIVRRQESVFGNILTDALKIYTNAEIAIINGGTIRGDKKYSPGQNIRRRDIIRELPYRSNPVLLKASGEQIYQAIEHGLSGIDEVLGRFLQVSGLTIKYDSSNPVGNRLISIKYKGENLDPKKHYKIAMSDYLAKGGDGFSIWNNSKKLSFKRQQNILISDIMINFIRERGTVNSNVTNRIIDTSQSKMEQ